MEKKKILIVDDNENTRLLLSDAILLDLGLPGGNGLRVLWRDRNLLRL